MKKYKRENEKKNEKRGSSLSKKGKIEVPRDVRNSKGP